jgi:hypothetical protein
MVGKPLKVLPYQIIENGPGQGGLAGAVIPISPGRPGAESQLVQHPLVPTSSAAMIKLTETREITPGVWVHPDEER